MSRETCPGPAGVDPTAPVPAPVTARSRVVGVDVARGLALLGMMAVHSFDVFRGDGSPTIPHQFVAGRSLATFVLLAGVSLAFIGGRQPPAPGSPRSATAAAITVRALFIGALGLTLNHVSPEEVILPYYAVFFLLAIPLLGLPSRALLAVAGALVVLAPLVVLGSFATDLPSYGTPGFASLLDPGGLAVTLLVTGFYPAVQYMASICVGLCIGRSDLSSLRVAGWLFGGGVALSLSSWLASSVILFRLGGLEQLGGAAPDGFDHRAATDVVLWDPDPTPTWWWLAERAPYTVTPLGMLHGLGTATAVLGAALLLTRSRLGARVLWPVAAAGSMTLSLYSAHILVLASGLLEERPVSLYLAMVVAALTFAVAWRLTRGQGPLERLVTGLATRARGAVAAGDPDRGRSSPG
jgi:uncharacterized membrane protein